MVGEEGGSRLIFIVLGTAACQGRTRYTSSHYRLTLTWNMKSWIGELVRLLASSTMLVVVGEGEGKVNITFSPCFSYAVREGTSWVVAGAAV